ncbi:hypothetical protein ACROYT_G036273 [Oculina patagonica]
MAAAKMSDRQHRRRLLEIAKSLISSDLDDLKFLCKDLIPAGEGEKITRPLEFFDRLEQLNLLSENNLGFLAEKLTDIKRIDLSCKLIGFTQDFALNKQQEEFNDVDALSQHETDFALNKQQEEFNDVDALSQHETDFALNKQQEEFNDVDALSEHETVIYRNKSHQVQECGHRQDRKGNETLNARLISREDLWIQSPSSNTCGRRQDRKGNEKLNTRLIEKNF